MNCLKHLIDELRHLPDAALDALDELADAVGFVLGCLRS